MGLESGGKERGGCLGKQGEVWDEAGTRRCPATPDTFVSTYINK